MYDFEVGGLAVQVKTWAAFVNKENTGQLKTQRKNNQKEHGQWEFPGRLLIRTLHSHCRGAWVRFLVAELRSHKLHST